MINVLDIGNSTLYCTANVAVPLPAASTHNNAEEFMCHRVHTSLHLFNHLSATVVLTCCAAALMSY